MVATLPNDVFLPFAPDKRMVGLAFSPVVPPVRRGGLLH